MNLKKQYPGRVTLVFIKPPSIGALEDRLVKRKGDSPEAIERRLQNARREMARAGEFDHQITNDDLQDAYARLRAIVKKECGL